MNFKRLIIIITVILVSCNYKREDPLKALFNDLGDSTHPKFYLIIPLDACSSCVDTLIDFADENLKNEKITFVFTCREKKIFKLKLNKAQIDSENILLDRTGLLERAGVGGDKFILLETQNDSFISKQDLLPINLDQELEKLSMLIN